MILHLHRQQRKKKPPTLIPILHDILLEDEMNIWAEKHIGRWRFYLSPRGEGDIVYYFWNRRIVWGVDARSRGTCAHMASCRAQGGGPLWRTEGGGGTIPLIVGRIFKFESRISLGPPAMGHRSQSIRGESSLFLSPSPSISRVTKNRIRAEKKTDPGIFPLFLFLSSPATRDAFACEKAEESRTGGFSLLSDSRTAEVGKNFWIFERGTNCEKLGLKKKRTMRRIWMKFRIVFLIEIIKMFFLNKIYLISKNRDTNRDWNDRWLSTPKLYNYRKKR